MCEQHNAPSRRLQHRALGLEMSQANQISCCLLPGLCCLCAVDESQTFQTRPLVCVCPPPKKNLRCVPMFPPLYPSASQCSTPSSPQCPMFVFAQVPLSPPILPINFGDAFRTTECCSLGQTASSRSGVGEPAVKRQQQYWHKTARTHAEDLTGEKFSKVLASGNTMAGVQSCTWNVVRRLPCPWQSDLLP